MAAEYKRSHKWYPAWNYRKEVEDLNRASEDGWHYFRKPYDPALPEETYEIFTDRESQHEMENRWARLALWLGIICAVFAVFLAVIFIGCAAGVTLTELRPNLSSNQISADVIEPFTDNRWCFFDVKYGDNYYLDMDAETPFTFEIVRDVGEQMFSETGTDVHRDDIRIRLAKGRYWFSLSARDGFELDCWIG